MKPDDSTFARPPWPGAVVATLCVAFLAACGGGVTLITPDEYAPVADLEIDEVERGVPPPDAPRILVVQPDIGRPIGAPIDIEVRFEPAGDAQIDASSARVVYAKGFLRKDITDKLTGHGRIDENGIYCADAEIPPGKHRILLEVGDTRGRVGTAELRFTVRKD